MVRAIDTSGFPQAVRRLVQMLWSPAFVFAGLRQRPVWLGAYLLVGLGTAMVAWVTIPLFQNVVLRSLPDTVSSIQLEQIGRTNRMIHYVSTAAAALGTLIGWFASALVLWLIVQVVEGRGGFKALFSVVSHANVVILLHSVVVAAVMVARTQTAASGQEALQVSLGMDLFLNEAAHPSLRVLAASLNPFSVWYYSLIGIGVSAVCDTNRYRTILAVGVFWIVATGFGAGTAWAMAAFQIPTSSP